MLKKINFRSLLGNSWVLLFAAVLVAGGLTFLLYKYLTDREAKLKAEMAGQRNHAGIEVVVPSRDVPVGTPLSSGDFVAREIAPDLVYDDMIRAADFDTYRPSRLVRAVRRGLPLRAGDIDALRGRDFSDVVPAGQRALTLEIDTVNSTAAMVRPGNRVDIYWVGKNPDPQADTNAAPSDNKTIRLLMPDALILATGQDVRPRDAGEAMQNAGNPQTASNYGTVTLQVPVSEAARLVLAQKVGTLRLILRNSDDKDNRVPTQFVESNLFSPTTKASAGVVEIISGGGDMAQTKLIPVSPAASPAPAPAQPSSWSSDSSTEARQPSVYEEANQIAKQLQKIDTRGTPGRN